VIVKDEVMELTDQNSTTPSTVFPKDEIAETSEQDSREPFQGSDEALLSSVRKSRMQNNSFYDPPDHDCEYMNGEQECKDSDGTSPTTVRKCRMQPINYSEPPDLDWEADNEMKDKGLCTYDK
ncbi:hypothetical protein GDO78_011670, partial [Eleutherodactylus coqui]